MEEANIATVIASSRALPDDTELEIFKEDVRTWLELDNTVRRLQETLRDRRTAKTALNERIVRFMANYDIEDLNTREGRLRFRVSYPRVPLTQNAIRERITSFFEADPRIAEALDGQVFGHRERREHRSLARSGARGEPRQRPPPALG